MVGGLLTVLVVAVLQLALALHVRTTLIDTAAEGARVAAFADRDPGAGIARTRELISSTIGPGYAADIVAAEEMSDGVPSSVITVRAPLPIIGLLGLDRGLEVSARAPLERISSE